MRIQDPVAVEPMLVTRVGGLACAIPITHVIETMRPLPIEPVAEPGFGLVFLRGLSVIRGSPIPVVDVARLLGHTPREQARFVLVRTGADRIAMLVDAVLEVRSFDASTFAQLPPLLRDASRDMVTAIGTLDRGLMMVLDTARLLPEHVSRSLAPGPA